MKKNKILFNILIYIMLSGGIMGTIKVLIPNMEWLSYRHLLGMAGTFNNYDIPDYAVIYGVIIAILEIISSILLLAKRKVGIKFSIVTLSINALGCFIAILIGDVLAIGSLLIRLAAIYIVVKSRSFYFQLDKKAK